MKQQTYQRLLIGALVVVCIASAFALAFLASTLKAKQALGAVPSSGSLPGIYNATPTDLGLRDGYGSALATDQNGRLVISPSSTIAGSSVSSTVLLATNATTTNLDVTEKNRALIYQNLSQTFTSLGSLSTGATSTRRVVVQGDYAYISDGNVNKIHVVDVKNPAAMSVVSTVSLNVDCLPRDLAVEGSHVYVPCHNNPWVYILDVSNPADAFVTGRSEFNTATAYVPSVAVSGKNMYVANRGDQKLNVVDVSDPYHPITVSTTTFAGTLIDVVVQGKYAYLSDFGAGSRIYTIDVSNPAAPVNMSTTTVANRPDNLVVQGGLLLATESQTGQLAVLDITSATSVRQIATSTAMAGTENGVAVSGRYAVIPYYNSNGIRVMDISTPTSVVDVASSTVGVGFRPTDVTISNGRMYVLGFDSGKLNIYDLKGAEVSSLRSGTTYTGKLTVGQDGQVNGNMSVGSGLSVGRQGIMSEGGLTAGNAHFGTSSFGNFGNFPTVLEIDQTDATAWSTVMRHVNGDYNWAYYISDPGAWSIWQTTGTKAAFLLDPPELGDPDYASTTYTSGDVIPSSWNGNGAEAYSANIGRSQFPWSQIYAGQAYMTPKYPNNMFDNASGLLIKTTSSNLGISAGFLQAGGLYSYNYFGVNALDPLTSTGTLMLQDPADNSFSIGVNGQGGATGGQKASLKLSNVDDPSFHDRAPIIFKDQSATTSGRLFSFSATGTNVQLGLTQQDPNNGVYGSVGDIVLRSTGNSSGTQAYIKVLGDGTNTGWDGVVTKSMLTNLSATSVTANSFVSLYGSTSTFNGDVKLPSLQLADAGSYTLCWHVSSLRITNDGGSSCGISSARFKEHIASLDSKTMAEMVRKLRAVEYDYKEGVMIGPLGDRHDEGFAAEEVARIDPYLVGWEEATPEELAKIEKLYPDVGRLQNGKLMIPKTVRYDRITVVLTGAYQDLDARVTALESRVGLLEQLINWIKSFFN